MRKPTVSGIVGRRRCYIRSAAHHTSQRSRRNFANELQVRMALHFAFNLYLFSVTPIFRILSNGSSNASTHVSNLFNIDKQTGQLYIRDASALDVNHLKSEFIFFAVEVRSEMFGSIFCIALHMPYLRRCNRRFAAPINYTRHTPASRQLARQYWKHYFSVRFWSFPFEFTTD